MVSRYYIYNYVDPYGEMWFGLDDRDPGVNDPYLDYPDVYVTSQLRNVLATNSIKNHLGSIKLLLDWVDRFLESNGPVLSGDWQKWNAMEKLEYRFMRFDFFNALELDSLKNASLKIMLAGKEQFSTNFARQYNHLSYIARYLEWVIPEIIQAHHRSQWPLETKGNMKEMIKGILDRRRRLRKESRVKPPKAGLTEDQQVYLRTIIDPESKMNPFKGAIVRERNQLIVLLLLETGMRVGELAGLKMEHIVDNYNLICIERGKPDDPTDPRAIKPQVKTEGRRLKITENRSRIAHYEGEVIMMRRKRTMKHTFLFVSHRRGKSFRQPLVTRSLGLVFEIIRRADTENILPGDFSPHTMRYTWNDNFSRHCDNHPKMTAMEESRARIRQMGWAPTSLMAQRYNARHINEISDDLILGMAREQEESLAPTPSLASGNKNKGARQDHAVMDVSIHDIVHKKLILLRGLPGSGKSTLAKVIENKISVLGRRTPVSVASADDYFIDDGVYKFDLAKLPEAHAQCQQKAYDLLRGKRQESQTFRERGGKLVIDNTACRADYLAPYISLCKDIYGIIIFDLYDNGLSNRELAENNLHNVPEDTIRSMRAAWEHDSIIIKKYSEVEYISIRSKNK